MRCYLKEKVAAAVKKTVINSCEDPPHWPRDTLLPAEIGIKILQPAAVAQSV
jgi:hypothetical protein